MLPSPSALFPFMLNGAARLAAGLDVGVSYDRSALAVLARVPLAAINEGRDLRPRFLAFVHVWPAKTPHHIVLADVLALCPALAYLTVEVNGVGAMLGQEIRRHLLNARIATNLTQLATTSRTKTVGYSTLLHLIGLEALLLPRHADLLRQLSGLQYEQGERGFTRIGAGDDATHDDVSDALMLATQPLKKDSRVGTRLARWADPEFAPSDSQVPPDYDGGDIQELPSGLRVWTRPPLQSPAGQRLTLPHRLTNNDPVHIGDLVIDRRLT